jgi:2-polyprenyl-3-methyl-5-hydroxy-6-metoxy-1,4-benzoquinol methylase
MEQGWATFWKNQAHSFDEVMRVSTSYFTRRFVEKFAITSESKILDYGCGPGFLADALAPLKINVTGADINPSFVDQCLKNHPQSKTILITTDPDQNKLILDNNLGEKRFDFIIVLSISQYLPNVDELERMIQLLKGYLSVRGKIVVADVVDPNNSALRDLIAIKFECIRQGKIIAFIKFFFYLVFSNYRQLSKNVKLLQISSTDMNRIAANNQLQCEKVHKLTVHPTRTNYAFSK